MNKEELKISDIIQHLDSYTKDKDQDAPMSDNEIKHFADLISRAFKNEFGKID